MNIEKLQQIEFKLKNGQITYQEAADVIYNQSTKSWQSKEWQEKRKEVLKDQCEQCVSSKKPLVAQHMWHPDNYRELFSKVSNEVLNKVKEDNPIDVIFPYDSIDIKDYTDRNTCPKCGIRGIYYRKTTDDWRCQQAHVFKTPYFGDYMLKTPTEVIEKKKERIRHSLWDKYCREKNMEEHIEIIREEAVLQSVQQSIRYLSFEDVVTFCKKCAFLWDEKGMKLCKYCGEKYHRRSSISCPDCMETALEDEENANSFERMLSDIKK